jgi:hypothetical protein
MDAGGRDISLRYYSGIFLERLRKTMKSLCQDSRSPGVDLNPGPPAYEAGVLTTRPRRLDGVKRLDSVSGHFFNL